MLGQFLLRQPAETGTAWDVAFGAAEARRRTDLAGDILLDALCLDPDAERFLTERVDLLLGNGAKHFTRLLLRFHHVATVPDRRRNGTDAWRSACTWRRITARLSSAGGRLFSVSSSRIGSD